MYNESALNKDLLGRCAVFLALMLAVVITSETSVSFYQTTMCNILKDSYLLLIVRT
jgi:hypothetical protein